MSVGLVFAQCVEPCIERIPVLEVTHEEHHGGRVYIVSQVTQRNVFTEFDRKLSHHLAATRGVGFPDFTVAVTVAERGGPAPLKPLTQAHCASVPHALKGIAERAFGQVDRVELTVHHTDPSADDRIAGVRRTVARDDVEALDAGLGICRLLGAFEFLSVSGDFDLVLARPPGDLEPMTMHLRNGLISIPHAGASSMPFECPLHGFAAHLRDDLTAQTYMARARHALVAAKEDAVTEFRRAAERQILNFDRALAGRPLTEHRLDSAVALVERLKAGLSASLNGLSEDARITALEWSASIAAGRDMGTPAGSLNLARVARG